MTGNGSSMIERSSGPEIVHKLDKIKTLVDNLPTVENSEVF